MDYYQKERGEPSVSGSSNIVVLCWQAIKSAQHRGRGLPVRGTRLEVTLDHHMLIRGLIRGLLRGCCQKVSRRYEYGWSGVD